MRRWYLITKAFVTHHVGENDGSGVDGSGGGDGSSADEAAVAAAAAAAATAAAAAAASSGGAGGNNDDPLARLKFTPEQQAFLNKKLAEEKKKGQAQNEKTITELKKLQTTQGTSERQKQELQTRIEELQQQYMTKEELAKKERDKKEKEFQDERAKIQAERDQWKGQFHNSTISRSIQDAAVFADAYSPAQVVLMLERNTRLVEEVDSNGSPTGNYTTRVKFSDVDGDGNPVVLDLTVPETLKRMKELPDKYGNLFKSGVAGGLGQTGNQNGKKVKIDFSKMTVAQYMKYRKEHPDLNIESAQQTQ